MRGILFLVTIILSVSEAMAQNFQWAKKIGGTGIVDGLVKVDSAGNTYGYGFFTDSADFDPGPGEYKLKSSGSVDAFLSKMDPFGNLEWAIQLGSTSSDGAYGLTVDKSGNLLLVGFFSGTVDFDPGPETHNLVAYHIGTEKDAFILKLSPEGNYIWANGLGGRKSDRADDILTNATGDVFVSGIFTDTTDFDPGPGVYNLMADFSGDAFILKLNAAGNFEKVVQFGGPYDSFFFRSMIFDGSGNLLLGGTFRDTIDFDPGPGSTVLIGKPGGSHSFILKLDQEFNYLWSKQIFSRQEARSYSTKTDQSGNIFVSGYFSDTTDFDPGPEINKLSPTGNYDGFVLKLDPNGNFGWVKTFGGSPSTGASISDLAIDDTGRIHLVGIYRSGPVDLDPSPGSSIVPLVGERDIFMVKLTETGDFISGHSIGGSQDEWAYKLIFQNGSLFFSGSFASTGVDFDPGPGTSILNASGMMNVFFIKLGEGFLPEVFSFGATNITAESATITGQVNNLQGNLIIDRGICFSTFTNPTLADSTVSSGTGAGSFTSILEGLSPNITYYARAYAKTDNATIYGNQVSFTTLVTSHSATSRQRILKAYPNPIREKIYIELGDTQIQTGFSVFNSYGRLMFTGVFKPGRNEIPVDKLSPGLYLLNADHFSHPLKLIKD